MRSLGLGTGVLLLVLAAAYITGNWTMFVMLSLVIGGLALLLAGVLSGALVSGDRGRANYSGEEDYRRRQKWAFNLFLFGLPSIIGTALAYHYFL